MGKQRSKSKKAAKAGKAKQPPLISLPDVPTVLTNAPQGRRRLTKEHIAAFLHALAQGHSVTDACLAINFTREHMYDLRKEDEQFRELWAQAIELGTAALEDLAIKRARSYSDNLLMFLLKGRDPKYGLPRGGSVRFPGAGGEGGEGAGGGQPVTFTFDFGNDVKLND